ncbi:MAG: DEAD/DEAH box helicase [Armatimonadota bacterium]
MIYKDKTCICRDCNEEFVFSAQEQEKFREQNFNPPTRCNDCHEKRVIRRKYSRGGEFKTHVVACSVCGKDTELPFNPSDKKPVFCNECYKDHLRTKVNPVKKEFILKNNETPGQTENQPVDTSTFSSFNLDSRLYKAVCEAGYETPTPVQAATIPVALEGQDLIGTAQTGTGKTAAFVLPILQYILDNPVSKSCTRALVLTPTRELAEQISDSFKQLGKYTKVKIATVYGGVNMGPQEHALRTGVDVIVACPGRLLDHIERKNTDFTKIEKVVIDEADRMLDMGFLPPIKRILSYLPKKRQTMLFSATFAPELTKLIADALHNPQRLEVGLSAPAKTVAHVLYPCPQHLKTSLVLKLLDRTDTNSVLIFTRTKHRANRVAEQIQKAGYGTAALHANKSQNQRQAALDDFRLGRCQILVATDIAARGLDVETISHVINYDIPDTADTYIHRIGRTGRAEREGDAMTLVTKLDLPIIWEIEKTLGSPIERRKLDDFDYTEPPARIDEFKRAPMPRKKVSPNTVSDNPSNVKAQTKYSGNFISRNKPR